MNPALRLVGLLSPADADARAWRDAVIANGGTVSGLTLNAVSRFCRSAKSAGLWSKLTRINLICGDQLKAAQVPLKVGGGSSVETLTNIVAGDYVETGATGGIKGNGTDKSFNTGFNPSSAGCSLTSTSLWAYYSGSDGGVNNRTVIGCREITPSVSFVLVGTESSGTNDCGGVAALSGTEVAPSSPIALREGFVGVTTNGSRAQQFYANGTAVGSTATATGAQMPNRTISCLGLFNGDANSVINFSTRYIRGYAIGTGMSAAEVSALNQIMRQFQTTLSRNV